MFDVELPAELASKAALLAPPASYDGIVDIIEYAEEKTATCVRVILSKKLGGVSSLVISADALIHHPKKLVKTSAGSSNSRARFARGWQTIGDSMLLFTKATTEIDTKYTVSFCFTSTQDGEEASQCGSIVYSSDFDVESGDEHLPYLLQTFGLKRKRILKVLQKMESEEEMMVVIPLRLSPKDRQPTLKIAPSGDDILPKATHGAIWGLKVHLAMSFLTPKLFIDVEQGSVPNQLWLRSLTQSETKKFTVDGDAEGASALMTCGYTNKWPIQSLLLLYNKGRLCGLMQPTKKSRSTYKFLGIVHEIDTEDPLQMGLLEQCLHHYLSELEELRSRHIRKTKPDEEWGLCTLCLKWSPISQPLVPGEEETCSNFNMLITCDDQPSALLPEVGSNKVPPTPATKKKARRTVLENTHNLSADRAQSPPLSAKKRPAKPSGDEPTAKVKAASKSVKKSAAKGSKAPSTGVTQSAVTESAVTQLAVTDSDAESVSKSPLKAAKKSPSKAVPGTPTKGANKSPTKAATESSTKAAPNSSTEAATNSPTKAAPKSPTKAAPKSPTKAAPKSPTKAAPKSPAKAAPKSPTKAASPTTANHLNSPTKAPAESMETTSPSRDTSVFDFASDSEPEARDMVPDSQSDEEMEGQSTTPALSMRGRKVNAQSSSVQKVEVSGGDNPVKKLEDYYSLSDDEDPNVLKMRELKCELIQSNKQLDLMRRTVIDYINLLLGRSSGHEAIVQPNASAEEVVGILRKLLEDKDELERQVLERQIKTKSKKR